jgi:hypothetical protein
MLGYRSPARLNSYIPCSKLGSPLYPRCVPSHGLVGAFWFFLIEALVFTSCVGGHVKTFAVAFPPVACVGVSAMIEDGQLWKNFKGGLYRTRGVAQPIREIGAESLSELCAARHSETLNTIDVLIDEEGRLWADVLEPHVIYKSINDDTTWWARPESMWSELTKTNVPRFRLIG